MMSCISLALSRDDIETMALEKLASIRKDSGLPDLDRITIEWAPTWAATPKYIRVLTAYSESDAGKA